MEADIRGVLSLITWARRLVGQVVLTVTGCEALYADMGHFGVQSIRMACPTISGKTRKEHSPRVPHAPCKLISILFSISRTHTASLLSGMAEWPVGGCA